MGNPYAGLTDYLTFHRVETNYRHRTESGFDVAKLRKGHNLLKEASFIPCLPQKGYCSRGLYINVHTLEVKEQPVSQQMKDIFIGGRGFGLWQLWHAVSPTTKWSDPENEIIICPGPLSGITQYPGSGKSTVVSISPQTDIPIDSNVGGFFGPLLKFSGFDFLEIQGKAEKETLIFIDGQNGTIRLEECTLEPLDSHILAELLTEMYAADPKDRVNISVISAGSAADNSLIGMLNFSWFDKRRGCVRLKQA
jgi:aldehyde:ferredoxin oxidoreductase